MIGYVSNNKILNCYATGNVTNTGTGFSATSTPQTGGLYGSNYGSEITNCYSSGNVQLQTPSDKATVGGICGFIDRFDPAYKNVIYLRAML